MQRTSYKIWLLATQYSLPIPRTGVSKIRPAKGFYLACNWPLSPAQPRHRRQPRPWRMQLVPTPLACSTVWAAQRQDSASWQPQWWQSLLLPAATCVTAATGLSPWHAGLSIPHPPLRAPDRARGQDLHRDWPGPLRAGHTRPGCWDGATCWQAGSGVQEWDRQAGVRAEIQSIPHMTDCDWLNPGVGGDLAPAAPIPAQTYAGSLSSVRLQRSEVQQHRAVPVDRDYIRLPHTALQPCCTRAVCPHLCWGRSSGSWATGRHSTPLLDCAGHNPSCREWITAWPQSHPPIPLWDATPHLPTAPSPPLGWACPAHEGPRPVEESTT